MKESLLSHIASNFISEYENVANSSITYLLNKYPSARNALKTVLNIKDAPTYYTTELATDNNGRPDVVGRDNDGKITIIIEGKFWANLTDNQPVNYLKELQPTGRLLFLAPDKRMESLKFEITKRLNKEDKRVIVYSWNAFLNLMETENNKNYDNQLASDLPQLKEMCQKMDAEGIPPLSMSDLDPVNGRRAYQFANLMDECNRLIRKWNKSDFAGLKTTGGKDGYGFYFKAFDFTCKLFFSTYDWAYRGSHSPFSLYIWDKNFKTSEKIHHYLNIFDPENSYNDKNASVYAITLKPGMDKEQIVNHLVNKTKEVLSFLNSNISP